MQARWKYIRFTLILFFVLCISTTQAASLQGSVSIQTTGAINYSSLKVGIYVDTWNFNEYNASTIANTFDVSQSWWVGSPPNPSDPTAKMNQVHTSNPNFKALVYRDVMCIYDYWSDEWNYANSQGWLLKDVNGNYVSMAGYPDHYVVDITNASYQQWLGAKVELWLTQYPYFDGVMADNSLKYSAQLFVGECNATPIDPSTHTYFTDQEILDGCAGTLNAIIDAIGTNKLLVPNGIWSGSVWWSPQSGDAYRYILSKVPRLSGLASEGTFRAYDDQWYSESDWKQSVDFVAWVQDNLLSGHTARCFSAACITAALPSGATMEQVIMYGFSSMLLATKYSSPQNTIDFVIDYSQNTNLLPLVQKLRNVNMITPLGDYYKINSTSVYTRDFVKGKVLVNPSSTSYQVSLSGTYTNFYDNSTATSSILVPAHTGIILLS